MAEITITLKDTDTGVEIEVDGAESEDATTPAELLTASIIHTLDKIKDYIDSEAEESGANDKG